MKILARVADEEREELERLRLDRDRPAVAQEPVTGEVDLDAAEVDEGRQRPTAALLARAGRAPGSAPVSSRRLNGFVT